MSSSAGRGDLDPLVGSILPLGCPFQPHIQARSYHSGGMKLFPSLQELTSIFLLMVETDNVLVDCKFGNSDLVLSREDSRRGRIEGLSLSGRYVTPIITVSFMGDGMNVKVK